MTDIFIGSWECPSCGDIIQQGYPNTDEGVQRHADDMYSASYGGLICDDCAEDVIDDIIEDIYDDNDDWENLVTRLAGSHL